MTVPNAAPRLVVLMPEAEPPKKVRKPTPYIDKGVARNLDKMTDAEIKKIKELLDYLPQVAVARRFGVSKTTIQRIKKRRDNA